MASQTVAQTRYQAKVADGTVTPNYDAATELRLAEEHARKLARSRQRSVEAGLPEWAIVFPD